MNQEKSDSTPKRQSLMHHSSLTNMIMYQLLKFIYSFISSVSRVAFLLNGKGVREYGLSVRKS